MLSCIHTVKNRSRRSSKRVLEYNAAIAASHSRTRTNLRHGPTRSRSQIYSIQVMEEEGYRVKVHYVGYSSRYDEWIRRSQIVYKPVHQPCTPNNESRNEHSLALLALGSQIKQKLVPSRKTEDPAVRIQLPFSTSTFELLRRAGESWGNSRGNHLYTIKEYSDFNELLGEQWFMRIYNVNGDFSYALKETIRFYIMQPKSLLDFSVTRSTAGDIELSPFYTPQPSTLVFTFVRKDGNKRNLAELM